MMPLSEPMVEKVRPAWETSNQDHFSLAGFDGDQRDPLANLNYTPADSERSPLHRSMVKLSNLNIISVLSGYNCEALAEDVSVHLDALNQ